MSSERFTRDTDFGIQAGTLVTPDSPTGAAVLMMHGYKSNREGYEEYASAIATRLGVACMTIDLLGHGESKTTIDFNELMINDYMDDVVETFDHLSHLDGVDPTRIGVVGASFSGYLTAMLLAERDPKKVLLRAPALYDDREIGIPREQMNAGKMKKFRRGLAKAIPSNIALNAVAEFEGEVTIVESENDESILPCVIAAYAGVAQDGIHRIIKGAGHSLQGSSRAEFADIVVGWARGL